MEPMIRKPEILRRYWFEFETPPREKSDRIIMDCGAPPTACGVTAYDYQDALALLEHVVFKDKPFPRIASVVEDVDMSQLLERNKHIRCCPVWRGVWWPSPIGSGPFLGSVTES
jgi:hypothetical protein